MTSGVSDTRRARPAAANGLEVRRSPIYGMGCFALERLPARKKFALYAGEIVRGHRRIEARLRTQNAVKVIRLRYDLAIDGAAGGDETAYINHSCKPNAFMRIIPRRAGGLLRPARHLAGGRDHD